MRTVWKFPVPVNVLSASFTTMHSIPDGAKLLHVREQGDNLVMWFEVDPEAPPLRRGFQLHGTGHPTIRPGLEYVGTGIFANGELVLHLYEAVSD